jgi:hypothetical protein
MKSQSNYCRAGDRLSRIIPSIESLAISTSSSKDLNSLIGSLFDVGASVGFLVGLKLGFLVSFGDGRLVGEGVAAEVARTVGSLKGLLVGNVVGIIGF